VATGEEEEEERGGARRRRSFICDKGAHMCVDVQVLAGPNPLMVVNERSNIQTQPPAVARTGPTNIIEGNVAVDQQYYPAAPLGM